MRRRSMNSTRNVVPNEEGPSGPKPVPPWMVYVRNPDRCWVTRVLVGPNTWVAVTVSDCVTHMVLNTFIDCSVTGGVPGQTKNYRHFIIWTNSLGPSYFTWTWVVAVTWRTVHKVEPYTSDTGIFSTRNHVPERTHDPRRPPWQMCLSLYSVIEETTVRV